MLLYETVFVVPADLSPQKTDEYVEKIKNMITAKGGEVVLVDKWGRRRLSYPIRRHREGFYTFLQFKAPSAFIAELNQFFRVSEEVIRQVICKALKGKPASPTMSLPPVAPGSHGFGGHGSHGPRSHGAPAMTAAPAVAPAAAPTEESHGQPAPAAPAQ